MSVAVATPNFNTLASNHVSSHPYTCNTCQIAFRGSELQRTHMQSDWHRYNLKRRVASLPPLTSEIFAEKVLANQASAVATAAKASFEKVCSACLRTYYSENAYTNHLSSQKHKARITQLSGVSSIGVDDETGSMISSAFSLGEPIGDKPSTAEEVVTEAVPDSVERTRLKNSSPKVSASLTPSPQNTDIPGAVLSARPVAETTETGKGDPGNLRTCLFCNIQSANIHINVTHMRKNHGMFIPEQSYLVDLEGLVQYLHDRVFALHECLYCGQQKPTTFGAQAHMRDKGHCMIAFETEEEMIEVGQYYDFTSTYSDAEEDNSNEGDEDEWESEDEDSEALAKDQETSAQKVVPSRLRSSLASQPIYCDEYELHLPTGRTAGHRSLARYFRQNLHNHPTPEERATRLAISETAADSGGIDGNGGIMVHSHDRGRQAMTHAQGGLGMLGVTDAKKREVRAAERKDLKKAQRQQAKYQWGNEKRSNHQKHFRDPLLQ